MASATYNALDKAWRSTCRVLFGQEVGELALFRDWICEYDYSTRIEKSSISGKDIAITMDDFSPHARYLSFEEVNFQKKFEPIGINDMKDIDSLVAAAEERIAYTGNVVLGNSLYVEGSTGVTDSNFVLDSRMVNNSKYIAYSRWEANVEYCFGGFGTTLGKFIVKSSGSNITRCFDCHMVNDLSDCYYCAKAINCRECMLCFGTENKTHCIGNTSLARDEYAQLKKKLLSEIAETMKKDKRIFSLLRIIELSSKYPVNELNIPFPKARERPFTLQPIKDAFSKTSTLLLGRGLGLLDCEKFLQRHVPPNPEIKSCLSKSKLLVGGYRANLLSLYDLEPRMATEDEIREIGKHGIGRGKVGALKMDADSLCELLHPIVYFNLEKDTGKISNVGKCAVVINSSDGYATCALIQSKKCAYCFWPLDSESMFGCYMAHSSSFCMNAYNSKKLTRCFEVDSCESCSDAYFLHNCENVRDSMFCFNAKNLAHAIGNAALPVEEYKRVKSSLVAQIAGELEKKKDLKWDIFTIGAREAK